jgi:hypothetical protein
MHPLTSLLLRYLNIILKDIFPRSVVVCFCCQLWSDLNDFRLLALSIIKCNVALQWRIVLSPFRYSKLSLYALECGLACAAYVQRITY